MAATLPLLDVLRGAESYLAERGVENPRLNAEHLLAHALGLKRMELYLQFDRQLTETERAPLRETVKRRGELALKIAQSTPSPTILDVGTGSGVIALTLALEIPGSEVHAADIATDALALAAENAARHGITDRIRLHCTDLLPSGDTKFDLIVANLPYIPSGEIAALSPEVRADPITALDGGPDGLDLICRLVAAGPDRLTPGGALLMEMGAGQEDAVRALLADRKFRDISARSDYQNIPRFAVGFHG